MKPPDRSAKQDSEASIRFDELFAQVDTAGGFGHRQHVHLTWLAVRAHGTTQAMQIVTDGLQRVARYAQVPQKYHVTMSRAWVLLVAHHVHEDNDSDFQRFISQNDGLLDKRLLTRFYRSTTLASPDARSGWVEPDLAPLPERL
jgi:hypothetical protein